MRDIDRPSVRLKLLSENNVILAKCEGMETEVFMPAIIDGRISIINVIPQRRCNCISTTHLVAKRKVTDAVQQSLSETLNNWQVTLSSHKKIQQTREPLANSTPAQLKFDTIKVRGKTTSLSCPAPEPMRMALAEMNSSFITAVAGGNKSLHLNSFSSRQSVNQFGHISPAINDFRDFETPANNICDLGWPQTPPPKKLLKSGNNTLQTPSIASPNVPQWRKVITPVRTYARRNHALNSTFRPLNSGVPQQHLENATQAPTANHTSVLKIRKLIIDKKLAISPRSFKQQLNGESSELLHQQHRKEVKSFFRGVSRKIAFELLTTPATRPNIVGKPLTELFRKCCVNKGSSTYPKYKKLCITEPIEQEALTPIFKIGHPARLREFNGKKLYTTPMIINNPELRNHNDNVQLKNSSSSSEATSSSTQNLSLISPYNFHINKPASVVIKSKNLPQKMFIPFSV